MKHRHLIALLQEGYTTIQVVFNDDVRGRSKPYTYKAPLSAGVEVGDRVVVDSPSNGLVVVEVVGTDKAPRIDLDADFTYKWIVQKVELKAYEEQLEREAKAMDALQVEVGKLKDLEVSRCVKINGYIVDNARLAEEVVRLQAKIEVMERQEPVAWLYDDGRFVWRKTAPHEINYADCKMAFYALPGAQTQGEEK